jgi:hypothetical protein
MVWQINSWSICKSVSSFSVVSLGIVSGGISVFSQEQKNSAKHNKTIKSFFKKNRPPL